MRRMYCKFGFVLACTVVASMMGLIAPCGAFAQFTSPKFQYVFPLFNSQAGSEVVVDNLSGSIASVEVILADSSTNTLVDATATIAARSQQRLTAASFGLSSFSGTIYLNATVPISAVATLADSSGHFETVAPAASADTVIVPFGPA